MRRSSFVVLLVMIGFAGGFWMYARRAVANEHAAHASLQADARNLHAQLEKLQRERDDAKRVAAEIARDLQPGAEAASVLSARDKIQIQSWMEKVKRLRGVFAQRPDQSSPELTLLTELDWLELAQTIPAEADEREARFRVRDFANERFFSLLRVAVRDHSLRTGGATLNDPMELLSFFRPAIDPAILACYEIVNSLGPGPSIVARAPVDPEYDVRRSFLILKGAANVGSLMSAPWGFDPLMKAQTEAKAAYQVANGKLPTKSSDLLAYATDSTGRALFAARAAYEEAHDGKPFSALSELLPYVTDPAIRPLFESMARAEERQRVLREPTKNP